MREIDITALAEKLPDPTLSRQRKWQIRKIIGGNCEICGKPREEDRANVTRCEKCEGKRHEKKPAEKIKKADSGSQRKGQGRDLSRNGRNARQGK